LLDGYAAYSHPYYPFGLPLFAAAIASWVGFWNEHLPKLALALFALPPLILLSRVFTGRTALVAALFFSYAVIGRFFWNGYMDGILALNAAVSVAALYFSRDRQTQSLGLMTLTLCPLLKDEGQVLMVVVLVGYVALLFLRRDLTFAFIKDYAYRVPMLAVFLLTMTSLISWRVIGSLNPVEYDFLRGNTSTIVERIIQRLEGQEISLILNELFIQTGVLYLMAISMIVFALVCMKGQYSLRQILQTFLLWDVMLGYVAVLCIVYLMTPYDVKWHLDTSVDRLVLTPKLGFLFCFLVGLSSLCLVSERDQNVTK
jgi:hypothetical protein